MKTVSLLAATVSRQPLHMMHHRIGNAEESRECTIHKGYASSRKPVHQYTRLQVDLICRRYCRQKIHSRYCRQKIYSRYCRQKNVIARVACQGPTA